MDSQLTLPRTALRIAIGLMAALAGLDKFFNLLTDWPSYIAPAAAALLPVSGHVFMMIVGVIEFAVGITILFVKPSVAAYAASVWLVLIAANLVLGAHYDIAVRDVVLSVAAFSLARLEAFESAGVAERTATLRAATA